MSPEQENRCVQQTLAGDADAFEPLVRAYEKPVYNLALRMLGNAEDAEDAAQETFLKAYRSLSSYRGDSRFSVWLYRVASNVCLDALRRRQRRPEQSLTREDEDGEELQFDVPDESFSPQALLERKLTREALRRGLEALPPEQRQILLLRELEGLSYEEIGRALELEEGTVKSRIFRARKRLCAFLQRDGNISGTAAFNRREGGERP